MDDINPELPQTDAALVAGIDNPLFYNENTSLLFGDAKESVGKVLKEVEAL